MSFTTEYLDLSGAQSPVNKFYDFDGVQYVFKLKFNDIGSFYTIEIFDAASENFLYSNKIVYNQNMLDSVLSPISGKIIPINIDVLQGNAGTVEISETSLGVSIKLYTDIVSE